MDVKAGSPLGEVDLKSAFQILVNLKKSNWNIVNMTLRLESEDLAKVFVSSTYSTIIHFCFFWPNFHINIRFDDESRQKVTWNQANLQLWKDKSGTAITLRFLNVFVIVLILVYLLITRRGPSSEGLKQVVQIYFKTRSKCFSVTGKLTFNLKQFFQSTTYLLRSESIKNVNY